MSPEPSPADEALLALYGPSLPVLRAAGPAVKETPVAPSFKPAPAPEPVAAPSRPASTSAAEPRLSGSAEKVAALRKIWEQEIRDCQKCALAPTRIQSVFGEGNADAEILFVGEGPGVEEDKQGRPFVGPAGQLLDKMIQAMGLKREEVFIANAVKCHPPGVPPLQNRPPRPEEIDACSDYLKRQLALIRPKIIVALGRSASDALGLKGGSLASLREKDHQFEGLPLRVTYHPSALLRPSAQQKEMKKAAWEDLKGVLQFLGKKVP